MRRSPRLVVTSIVVEQDCFQTELRITGNTEQQTNLFPQVFGELMSGV